MPTFAIGVDLGGTNLRIAAVDDSGTLLEKTTTGTQVARGRDFVIDEMCQAIRATVTKFSSSTLAGIGIGVPGIIDMATGMLRESPNLPGWHNYPVRDEIERRLGAKVILENDANSAALGEKWLGAGRDYDDMLMLTLGTGVGGGLVLQGRIWRGTRGMAGEPGHITVEPEGPPCPCGNRGCLEQLASATAVIRMAREAIEKGASPALKRAYHEDAEFGANVVYQMAVQGEAAAKDIFRRVGWALGIGLADLINLLNLPMYVIGGGVSNAWDAFLPAMMEEIKKRSFVYRATAPEDSSPGRKTIITRALLGGEAGLFGAARLPMLVTEAAIHEGVRKRA